MKAVQRMLGHKSAAMTVDVYAGLVDEELENLADRLEDLHDAYDVADLAGTERAQVLLKYDR